MATSKRHDEGSRVELLRAFGAAVNMDAADLESWLATDASKSVGWPPKRAPGEESVGHASGRRILQIMRTRSRGGDQALSPEDFAHMRKVVGFIRRHLAQRPLRDPTHSRWRYSLMNWGHDPLR